MDDQRTDEELIAAANAGDAAGFEGLYARHREWVFGVAWRFTRHREAAADAAQETFMYLLRKFPGFTLTAKLKTFLYPVIRHNALAAKGRARTARPEPFEEANFPPSDAGSAQAAERRSGLDLLRRTMESLEPGHREVVILRFAEELDLQEIALAMELPLGTVKSRLHHALAKLRTDPALKNFFEKA